MKKNILLLVIAFSLISASGKANEDINLHNQNILEKQFQNTQEFTSWYKTLSQADKNQALAGTVALCRPDLMNIALRNGGDIKTHIMAIRVHIINGPGFLFIYSHPSKDKNQEIKLYQQERKESHRYIMESNDFDGFQRYNVTDGLVTLDSGAVRMCDIKTATEILNILEQYKADVKQDEQNLLSRAVIENDPETVEYLLDKGTPINSFEYILHHAFFIRKKGSIALDEEAIRNMLNLILSHVGINYQDKNGETALFYTIAAAFRENSGICEEYINISKFLLEKGIDVNILNNKGENAFDGCSYQFCKLHPEGLKRFDPNHKAAEKGLYYAIQNDDYPTVKAYLDKGFKLNKISSRYLKDNISKMMKTFETQQKVLKEESTRHKALADGVIIDEYGNVISITHEKEHDGKETIQDIYTPPTDEHEIVDLIF